MGLLLGLVVVTPASSGSARAGVIPVPGLRGPVNLVVDRWGVPHIYAQSARDAFLAQGFNAARDRLFQIDLWLRKGTGRLAEVFGPDYVEQDRASRLLLHRGDIEREWASYGPEAKEAATAFATGVNAYVEWLAGHPTALPEEFEQLGYKPKRWTPEDVVRIRLHGLSYNLPSEVERARFACVADVKLDRVRVRLEPEHEPAAIEGFDPCTLPEDVLSTYNLARDGVQFVDGRLRAVPVDRRPGAGGSNNWALSPSRTTTGRPILANDPHRGIGVPSSRYVAHLNAPGLDIIGAGEAFAPGISIGHNQNAGFGLTVFPADQEDLYVYELDPADPNRYRYGDGWENVTRVTEKIPVAGGADQAVELAFTRHGPVIKVDAAHHRAYAVRAAWLEPGMSPYYGSLRYLRAKNFTEFQQAVGHWGAPPLNHVYADTGGDIGWVVGGLVPKRVGFDGLLPVPGDGRYEWNGFYAGADLPRSHNPERGFVATANEYNLPPDYPKDRQLGFEWAEPSRYQRIVEVLSAKPKHSLADVTALQNDQLTVIARRVAELIRRLPADKPSTEAALAMLRGWDGVEHPDSAAAALFEVWLANHLGPGFVALVLPAPAAELVYSPDITVLLEALENPERWFGPDAREVRDGLLLATLSSAYEEVEYRLGGKPADWKWGNLQRTRFNHPAAGQVAPEVAEKWNVGPFPRGGSWNTVDVSVSFDFGSEFAHLGGASFRMALDVGNWDASQVINTPGQSGDPNSPHYRDLADRWRTGKYVPMLYSRAAVLANTKQVFVLLPK
ncbi:penicillin acylase family protein [Actinosynnema sp. NPDC047251]|uniref:penicillin acylase family protein n=1 Tax=Saccharothrix espanaensis TaxID=103731 RepID=UPI0002FC10FF|nr:penicillin acylase family protein [Saccharothrix espanaensis]